MESPRQVNERRPVCRVPLVSITGSKTRIQGSTAEHGAESIMARTAAMAVAWNRRGFVAIACSEEDRTGSERLYLPPRRCVTGLNDAIHSLTAMSSGSRAAAKAAAVNA